MKFKDIQREEGTAEHPETIAQLALDAVDDGLTFEDLLMKFDYDSIDELRTALTEVIRAGATDPAVCKYAKAKDGKPAVPAAETLNRRAKMIWNNDALFAKTKSTIVDELWHAHFERKYFDERWQTFLSSAVRKDWSLVVARLTDAYGFTSEEIERLQFFICQVKAGRDFPASLRRMLYLWSKEKMTGKTTIAKALASALNGGEKDASRYSSDLATELGIKSFALPKISSMNAVLLDECFFKDMAKSYPTFKKRLTMNDGSSRLPYGKEFAWMGCPNYIATSNEPLSTFIADWNDRRYLSIEMRKPRKMSEKAIKEIWTDFVVAAEPPMTWTEWGERMAVTADEMGAMTERADEFEVILTGSNFADYIFAKNYNVSQPHHPDHRIMATNIIAYMRENLKDAKASEYRQEIIAAAERVFGERIVYGGGKYGCKIWWLGDMRDRLSAIRSETSEEKPF